ncbi:MAG TPA: glucose-1-phosphate cytidylyltransferase [Anaerolineaceae bacterium]|nr:glucose-1-phosphate cytidylyltransferase [Anaerolineaceae bacterium]HPN51436.1 glucose-1-phosphate cytidylyltransferase [Anaerolineaceae bacterium]
MKVIILAGGLGTRLSEETTLKPKPMVEIGGYPMLWHIMNIYAAHDIKEFVVALGYKAEIIKHYFLNYQLLSRDLTIQLNTGAVKTYDAPVDDWTVHLVDTGLMTTTGGRVKKLQKWIGDETFMFTYGDGVADINLNDLLAFHRRHGKLATVTAVRPPGRFGSLSIEGETIRGFAEKPQAGEGWINGGFCVFEPQVFDYITEDMPLESSPMENLALEGQLMAYQHSGFWQCMDTLRDVRYLESLWADNKAPWKVW